MSEPIRICVAGSCARPYLAKGFCRHHYHTQYVRITAQAREKHDEWWLQHKRAWDRNQPLAKHERKRAPYDFSRRLRLRVPYLKSDSCAYCGGPADSVDHIEPSDARTRRNTIDDLDRPENHWTNLTAACTACNSRKRQKSLLGFLYALRADRDIEQICRGISIGRPVTAPAIRRRRFAQPDDSRVGRTVIEMRAQAVAASGDDDE